MELLSKILKSIKGRASNYGFWVSLFALIPLATECLGATSIIPSNYQEITTLFLSLLVALGVTNNPTTKSKWYLDDKDKDKK